MSTPQHTSPRSPQSSYQYEYRLHGLAPVIRGGEMSTSGTESEIEIAPSNTTSNDSSYTSTDPEQRFSCKDSRRNCNCNYKCSPAAELKRDSHGLPLVPQPSPFKDDPLNWPTWLKWTVLIQVGFMAFLGIYTSALINPSLVLLSEALNVDSKTAAYSTTTAIIVGGVSPFILTPIANIYGRRPTTLFAISITMLGGVGSAVSPNFSTLLGTRAMAGFGMGGMMSVGTACGEKTGVYSIFVTNGAHIAALSKQPRTASFSYETSNSQYISSVGGFLGQAAGWQWDYGLGALSCALSLILAIFLFPETLFSRDASHLAARTQTRTYTQLLFDFRGNVHPTRSLQPSDFLQPFRMLKYPSIIFPFWYYTTAWTFCNVLPAITLASIYTSAYHLQPGPIGACLGISLTIGSVLGEFFAGRASDFLMLRLALRNGGVRRPAYRLYLCTLSAFFMPAGMVIFGATVGKTSYIPPLVGLAVAEFGLQITSTTLYTYTTDAHPSLAPSSGTLFNLSRGLSFIVGFFALPYAESVGYMGAWGTFAAVVGLSWMPVGGLMVWGDKWIGIDDVSIYV
ncbi:putative transporter [Lachnellula occidentalis]|uniref:Putative transporter n=1 Tax=Lachnellula occidentalis TaxID=215460 RepID=A0A8H8U6J3_9HELO|nr:putative transporter [Lachnellula occidentalis]